LTGGPSATIQGDDLEDDDTPVSVRLKRGERVSLVAVRFTGSNSYATAVVGESHYQPHLQKLMGKRRPEGKSADFLAFLVPEPDNAFDENAVMVLIKGDQVGYLAAADAEEFLFGMQEIERPDHVAAVDAFVAGGFQQEDRSWAHYGVWLDITLPFDLDEVQ
jgi:hypothetical protein